MSKRREGEGKRLNWADCNWGKSKMMKKKKQNNASNYHYNEEEQPIAATTNFDPDKMTMPVSGN